jgi:dihydroorotase
MEQKVPETSDKLLWEVPTELLTDQSTWVWDPVDLHHHFRDGVAMQSVVRDTARQFSAALAMPNLVPPVATVSEAMVYRENILKAIEEQNLPKMTPLMTLYLRDNTDPQDLLKNNDKSSPIEGKIVACKLYPAGATTNSHNGVTDVKKIYPVLEVMQQLGILLLIHAEVTDPQVDIFEREREFIATVVEQVVRDFPNLKVVLEHATTEYAVDFVMKASDNVAASITAHHLLLNRNALFEGGMRPHHYCLPVLKSERDRQALARAVTSGNPKFFLGTDSAPHAKNMKECCKGKAGCYTAHNALELYAETFYTAGVLDKLRAFSSTFGPRFYGFGSIPAHPFHREIRILRRLEKPKTVPETLDFGDNVVVPLRSGETVDFDFSLLSFHMDDEMKVSERAKQAPKWNEQTVEVSRQNWNDIVVRQSALSSIPEVAQIETLQATSKLGVNTTVRVYSPTIDSAGPIVVYFHSGALMFGSVETHDNVCRLLASKSMLSVVSVDYKLCPENNFEACLDDAFNVVEWLTTVHKPDSKLILTGDSSGALLAIAANRYLLKQNKGNFVLHSVYWYPSVGISTTPLVWDPKYIAGRKWVKSQAFSKPSKTPQAELENYYEPINAPDEDFKDFGPTLVVACAFDEGCPYQVDFARKLSRAGVSTKLWVFAGLHGALFQCGEIPSSLKLMDESARFLSSLH